MEMFHMYTCNFLVGLPKKPKNTQKGPPRGGLGGVPFWHFFFTGVFFRGWQANGIIAISP